VASMPTSLSLTEARRLALASQGFGLRPANPSISHLRKLANQIHAFQIDSVNVLIRAHYVPAFARLGAYPTEALDTLAYRKRELFEYWGHAACLMPASLFPLFRYRMQTDAMREYMATERGAYARAVYEEVAERGPLVAVDLSDPGKRTGNWWGWANGKAALEQLYDAGLVAIAGRRGFERVYDLVERIIPPAALEVDIPYGAAMKQLICLAAQACGVGTFEDITGYFKLYSYVDRRWERYNSAWSGPLLPAKRGLVAELVEDGQLVAAQVEGWKEPAYLAASARIPRKVSARAFVTPFDSLVWERSRLKRLFGMQYAIELYTPPPKRIYGYYVCPFLLGDSMVARCDLKADRFRKTLMVQSAFLEPGQDGPRIVEDAAAALREMQAWLGLDRIEVADRGDLAPLLRTALS
jgi:uncharacterized protein